MESQIQERPFIGNVNTSYKFALLRGDSRFPDADQAQPTLMENPLNIHCPV